jgi:hypothetical protein
MRTNLAANYSHSVTGGGGLMGAYRSNAASGSLRWQISRAWSVGTGAGYFLNKSVTPLSFQSTGSGHSMSENGRLSHSLSDHMSLDFSYDHVHQDYATIQSVAANPNSNRESISLSWEFTRPVGQ